MVSGAAARDRFYRKIQPLVGDEEADWLMDRLAEGEVTELATKDFVRQELREFRAEMAEFRTEMRTELADMRAEMRSYVTREELGEQLRLHVDARVGALGRSWMFATMGMQAATIAGVIAAVRL